MFFVTHSKTGQPRKIHCDNLRSNLTTQLKLISLLEADFLYLIKKYVNLRWNFLCLRFAGGCGWLYKGVNRYINKTRMALSS